MLCVVFRFVVCRVVVVCWCVCFGLDGLGFLFAVFVMFALCVRRCCVLFVCWFSPVCVCVRVVVL